MKNRFPPTWLWAFGFLASSVALLIGCASMEPDKPIVGRISELPPIVHPADNPTSPAKVALGAQLFLDKRMSGNGSMSCQSCHYRELGWTHGIALSKRADGQTNTRRSPPLYNVGHQTIWYWDGRSATMEAQTTAAWRNQMSADPDKIAAALNAIPEYKAQFNQVYGMDANGVNIVRSLTAYLRTKNSENAPWDQYEKGNVKAVSKEAVEGFQLFMGKGRCAVCHTPPHYGNSTFYNIGLEAGKARPDVGRFNVTKDENDMSAFKTPSLRSVALKAPYFHDGSAPTLEAAVRYMSNGGGNDPKKSPIMQPTGMTEDEIKKVVKFLESLTSTETWTAVAVPK
ncbi:MAG: cytochrome-c peroxidase [Brachymonas sp.]